MSTNLIKPFSFGTSWRTKTLNESVEIGKKYTKWAGISRISRIDPLSGINTPIYSIYRPNSQVPITVCSGKGTNELESMSSGIFEAIETKCAEYKPNSIIASEQELIEKKENFISISSLGGRDSGVPIEWVKVLQYEDNEELLVPMAQITLLPYTIPFQSDSNGLSSGLSLHESIFHGLLEIIERHNFSLALVNRHGLSVDLDKIEDVYIHNTLKKLTELHLSIEVKDISNWTGIPTYYCTLFSEFECDSHLIGGGLGTHLDPYIAINRAVTEAIQSRAVSISGTREDLTNTLRLKGQNFVTKSKRIFHYWYEKTDTKAVIPSKVDPITFDEAIKKILSTARMNDNNLKRFVYFQFNSPSEFFVTKAILEGSESFCLNRSRRGKQINQILQEVGL